MNELIFKLRSVMKTLEELDIKPTFTNMDKLLGCHQFLFMVVSELEKMPKPVKEEAKDGNDNAE